MSRGADLRCMHNGEALAWSEVPLVPLPALHNAIAGSIDAGLRVSALFATWRDDRHVLVAVLADDTAGELRVGAAPVEGDAFHSLTLRCPQVHLFEREIHEQTGLRVAGHPWLKPLRFARPLDAAKGTPAPAVGVMDFHRIEGDEVHEVAVGPVHAGVIEPGHFRFQCHGEHVFHLEISLGYQHRGIEEALRGGPRRDSLHQIEALAGDTTIGHTTAWCQVLEALAGLPVSPHAMTVRAVALELERLANHCGDLGALAGDIGYLPTASFCGRLRGDYLNMTAMVCGNRFGRSLLRPGGARFTIDAVMGEDLRQRLAIAGRETDEAANLLWVTPSVMARFEGVGAVGAGDAAALGLVGPAARASGAQHDVRADHPTGAYRFLQVPVASAPAGDVHARAFVRGLEIQRSLRFLDDLLGMLPATTDADVTAPAEARRATPRLARDHLAVALTEGWRGEICHVALTDGEGCLQRYKVVDPSFHNWPGLAMALRDQQISDFPLCNKSFNLSYCGHDL